MYKLRLIKARSYRGCGVTATRESPVVEVADAATAQKLYESGYFDEDEQPPEPGRQSGQNPESESGPEPESGESASGSETERGSTLEPDYDALSALSKAELTAYAQEHGIDINRCRTKSDILTAISVACGGSPTMIDLQRNSGE